MDCMGCGNCADICPAKEKALIMKPYREVVHEAENWDFGIKLPLRDDKYNGDTIKGSQFRKPYIEFSGAWPGTH